jgi:hypothetical protein
MAASGLLTITTGHIRISRAEIINEASYDPSAASDETLVKMIQMVHERGLHYLAATNWNGSSRRTT